MPEDLKLADQLSPRKRQLFDLLLKEKAQAATPCDRHRPKSPTFSGSSFDFVFLRPFKIDRFRDDEGRPFGENKVPEEERRAACTELVECRYAGARHRRSKPMNVSALQQMVKNWPQVLGALDFIRGLYVGESRSSIVLLPFWKITNAASLAPSFLIYRAIRPLGDDQLPAFVAALYTASLGLFDTAQAMALNGILTSEMEKNSLVDVDSVYDFAEKHEIFIGATEVCAVPFAGGQDSWRKRSSKIAGADREPVKLKESDMFIMPSINREGRGGRKTL
jgi:hypothetical protein